MAKRLFMVKVEDIMLFYGRHGTKADNDMNNKIRENIIANIIENINTTDKTYYSCPLYGNMWNNFREKLMNVLVSFCQDKPFNTIKIEEKGGMKFNYDFLVNYYGKCDQETEPPLLKAIKLEFKHNNSSLDKLPQFLEIYDKDFVESYSVSNNLYSDYYYEHYLDKYICLNDHSTQSKPSKSDYLKYIHDIKYSHPFFGELHSNKSVNLKLKRELANQSMKKYLEENSKSFDFSKITEKIKKSQRDKHYIMWNGNNFNTMTTNTENINISRIINSSPNKAYIDVEVDNFEYNLRIRLNWGNNLGLCNPRWKFTFINK
jgi:hypothetical protein